MKTKWSSVQEVGGSSYANLSQHVIHTFIISLANPDALIGSFLVGIFQYGPLKRSKPCIFVLEQSRQIHNLKQRYLKARQRKKCEYCHSSQRNYQKKLKILKFFTAGFKDG